MAPLFFPFRNYASSCEMLLVNISLIVPMFESWRSYIYWQNYLEDCNPEFCFDNLESLLKIFFCPTHSQITSPRHSHYHQCHLHFCCNKTLGLVRLDRSEKIFKDTINCPEKMMKIIILTKPISVFYLSSPRKKRADPKESRKIVPKVGN